MEKPGQNTPTAIMVSGLGNEQGIALIVVLIVLLLLSILGATVLTTSTSELRIAGNYRNMQQAFFTADAAIEFAQTSGLIYTSIIPGETNSWPNGTGKVLDANGQPTGTDADIQYKAKYNEMRIGNNKAFVRVDYTETGAVPAGSGSEVDAGLGSGTGFKANYFTVDVIGNGPNSSEVEIESYVARIIPK